MTYKVNIDEGPAQLAFGRLATQLKAALSEPIREAFSFPRGELAGGGAMVSQSMAAGWANIQTAAKEYTDKGFYQQMLFGSSPEHGRAGLQNHFMLQQQAASLPVLPGNMMNAHEMQSFSHAVMGAEIAGTDGTRFGDLFGFQKSFGRTMAAANQAGLMNFIKTPEQMMQADIAMAAVTPGFNKAYNVSPEMSGQLFAAVAGTGVRTTDLQGAYEGVIRAQASGVPAGASLGMLSRASDLQAFRATVGAEPSGLTTSTAEQAMVLGQILEQNLIRQGQVVRPGEGILFAETIASQMSLNTNSDRGREQGLRMAMSVHAGGRAKGLNAEDLLRQAGDLEITRGMTEERSAEIVATRQRFGLMMRPGLAFRDALGMAAGMFPEGPRSSAMDMLGFSERGHASASLDRGGMTPSILGLLGGRGGIGVLAAGGTVPEMRESQTRFSEMMASGDPNSMDFLRNYAEGLPGGMETLARDMIAYKATTKGGIAGLAAKIPGLSEFASGMAGSDSLVGSVVRSLDASATKGFLDYEAAGKGQIFNPKSITGPGGASFFELENEYVKKREDIQGEAGQAKGNVGSLSLLRAIREYTTGGDKKVILDGLPEDRVPGFNNFVAEADKARVGEGASERFEFGAGTWAAKLAVGAAKLANLESGAQAAKRVVAGQKVIEPMLAMAVDRKDLGGGEKYGPQLRELQENLRTTGNQQEAFTKFAGMVEKDPKAFGGLLRDTQSGMTFRPPKEVHVPLSNALVTASEQLSVVAKLMRGMGVGLPMSENP